MSPKELMFVSALFDVVTIFGEIETGCTELNLDTIGNYLNSPRIVNDFWGLKTKEDMYQFLTDDILNGNPIWYFLKLPEWTQNMLSKSFLDEIAEEERLLREKYPCYRDCQYFRRDEHEIGVIERCVCKELNPWNKRSTGPFKPKRSCRYYSKKEG